MPLAARIRRGLPLDQVLKIGADIADARPNTIR
jgi:hypothetical protein